MALGNSEFEQSAYWRRRLGKDIDLGVVGQRSLGRGYNEYIYARRTEALLDVLAGMGIDAAEANILDIGCGSGYYVRLWETLGSRRLLGLDVSEDSITRLRTAHPNYRFLSADITDPTVAASIREQFSIVTLFDVLYHIPEDDKALAALRNISDCLLPDGHLLVFDQLLNKDYSMLPHVKFRAKARFLELLNRAGMSLVAETPLFVLLAPPVFGRRHLDFCVSGLYKVAGYLFRWGPLGRGAGRVVYNIDKILRAAGITTPNHSLLIIRKRHK